MNDEVQTAWELFFSETPDEDGSMIVRAEFLTVDPSHNASIRFKPRRRRGEGTGRPYRNLHGLKQFAIWELERMKEDYEEQGMGCEINRDAGYLRLYNHQ